MANAPAAPGFEGTKNPVWETMTKIKFPNFSVRVWKEEKGWSIGPDQDVSRVAEANWNNCKKMVEELAELPNVSAIEIIDANGNGTLFYPDWK